MVYQESFLFRSKRHEITGIDIHHETSQLNIPPCDVSDRIPPVSLQPMVSHRPMPLVATIVGAIEDLFGG